MKVYVDASVVLRRVLKQSGAFQSWFEWELAVTSELLRVETFRRLDRLRVNRKISDEETADYLTALRILTTGFQVLPVQAAILQRATSPFPTALGTLDAIHLATALLWVEDHNEPLTLLTHDAELAIAARASGLDVLP